MSEPGLTRIVVVDDEEAILETMSFTFLDVYEVITANDAARALELMDEYAPVAVIITDQRMPGMTGVELLRAVYAKHPDTVRIMLTGFADSEATIRAINEGHVYAYINKPWEPEELKQVVKRAVEHYELAAENRRLVADLRRANSIMEAVMDRLHVGAIAIDNEGIIQAANRPASSYLGLQGDILGRSIDDVLHSRGLDALCARVKQLADAEGGSFEDHDLPAGGEGRRVRISAQRLGGANREEELGRVVLFKEISHEPLRHTFEDVVSKLSHETTALRGKLEEALTRLDELGQAAGSSGISSPSMAELAERVSRTQTAIQGWLDIDDMLAREEYPDAQQLRDRMRVASDRWPRAHEIPAPVAELAKRVEDYYESGLNPRERVL